MRDLKTLVQGVVVFVVLVVWLCVAYVPFCILSVVKLIIPASGFRQQVTGVLVGIAEVWVRGNWEIVNGLNLTWWEVRGVESIRSDESYLVISNHVSEVDILVALLVLGGRAPFMRFFLKHELIWMPVIGWACWALDFPFMKRFSKKYLERHPEKRGLDLEVARRACERFEGTPVSILNYVEGTRFRPSVYQRQKSPYGYLLKPKAGGVGLVFESMGEQLDAVLNVTVVYPDGVSILRFLGGDMAQISVDVERIAVPERLLGRAYSTDREYRADLYAWLNNLWEEKDHLIERRLTEFYEPATVKVA